MAGAGRAGGTPRERLVERAVALGVPAEVGRVYGTAWQRSMRECLRALGLLVLETDADEPSDEGELLRSCLGVMRCAQASPWGLDGAIGSQFCRLGVEVSAQSDCYLHYAAFKSSGDERTVASMEIALANELERAVASLDDGTGRRRR